MPTRLSRWTLALVVGCGLGACCAGADWPQFRGPQGSGVSSETDVPLTWSRRQNIRWRTELPPPGNNGSPIVSATSVFLATADDGGHKRSLHCYDRRTGRLRWAADVAFDGEESTHRSNPYAGSTPAADGSRVVVWHSSAGMHCYDYQGNRLWSRDLGTFRHIWGYGASPIIHGDLVINNCGPGAGQCLVALDKHSGKVVWKVDEPGGKSDNSKPWTGSWSTPVIARTNGREVILVSYPHHVKAYDPATGKVLWQCDGLGHLVYTSVVVGDGRAVAMGGFHGPAMGFTLGGRGNVTQDNVLWHHTGRNPQRIGSGVILGPRMYMGNEPGTVECLDVASGEKRWEAKLPGGGRLWASLVCAAGRLYATTQEGRTVVFAADPDRFQVLAVNPLDEPTNATIAVSQGQIFLRTNQALYCIETK